MTSVMRVALGQFNQATDELLRFAKQLGVDGVLLNTPKLPGEKRWEFMDLLQLRTRIEDYGLVLEALENVPLRFYDRAMLGLPGRDEQIENYQETIRNVGRAGIPILGYHWMPNSVWRTSETTPGRGGAHVTSFDLALAAHAPLTHGRVFDEAEMWQNYEHFMKAVLPVAEAANVKLALHPDDPPVESLGGVARLFRSFEGFRRGVIEVAPSPNHGLDFCMGCWSEMGKGVIEPIKYFGSRGKIFYVHFRDVQGVVPKFQECFIGEGNVNVVEAMRTLKDVGFTGFMIDDHVPHMVDDTEFGHRGRAHATGYMLGLLNAVNQLASKGNTG
jgi:mannonate dehydratase